MFCIRCGACLNACPIYRSVGGHSYGGTYAGPIGAVLTPLYDGLAENHHLPHASSLCGACQAACPVKIHIPDMLIQLREQLHHEPGQLSWIERLAYSLWGTLDAQPLDVSLRHMAGDAHDRAMETPLWLAIASAGRVAWLDQETRFPGPRRRGASAIGGRRRDQHER